MDPMMILISIMAFLISAAAANNEASKSPQGPARDTTGLITDTGRSRPDARASLLCSFISRETEDSLPHLEHIIYPICFIEGESLIDASSYVEEEGDYSEEDADTASLRATVAASFLSTYKDFAILSLGNRVGRVVVDSVVIRRFHCNGLCVGVGRYETETETTGREVAGFNTESPLVFKQTGIDRIPDSLMQALRIDSTIKQKYADHKVPTDFLDSVRLLYTARADLDGDGASELVVGSNIDTDSVIVSYVAVLKIRDSISIAWELDNLEVQRNHETMGSHYRIVDLIDLDGDKIPEIVIRAIAWEGESYQIYKYANNTFLKIFDGASSGC